MSEWFHFTGTMFLTFLSAFLLCFKVSDNEDQSGLTAFFLVLTILSLFLLWGGAVYWILGIL